MLVLPLVLPYAFAFYAKRKQQKHPGSDRLTSTRQFKQSRRVRGGSSNDEEQDATVQAVTTRRSATDTEWIAYRSCSHRVPHLGIFCSLSGGCLKLVSSWCV